jgi:hypothetical protein
MHDDSNLRLLERDLYALGEPREGDERVRLALREHLAASPPPRTPRRLWRRLTLASGALAAAAAAMALVALVGTNGPATPAVANAAIIHHALTVVTPPADKILHVEVVGVQHGVRVMAETWQETSAPYAFRGIKGEVGHEAEVADTGTTWFQYDPRTNTIYKRPDKSRLTFIDPIAQVREELARGQAHVAGTVVIDGASLYKINLPHGLVGYFDNSSYRPRFLDDPQRNGGVVRLRVAAYKYLPMTASNRALLSVPAQHPTARISASPGGGLSK